jgi:zinc transport system substrate-binding protein
MNPTRRAVLRGSAGILGAGALAGCLDDAAVENAAPEAGYAAFFTLWDWAEHVGGDAIDFENPVGTGEAGHGWQPSGSLTRNVADTGVFVYLDTPEFSWAQDVAATLEADYDTVTVIDALAGLEDRLLGWNHEVETGGHEHAGNGSHDHEGHDHGDTGHDPHVWLDPVLAGEMVDTIATGLADADPDNADSYEERAAAYVAGLESLDGRFRDLVESADRRTAVFAGHDSFTYLQERYGFDLHTPVGVSPQESPSSAAISETISLIDEAGIGTLLYDPFEAPGDEYPQLVETLLRDSTATDATPLTHLSGTLPTWQDEGWGYREQMEEINLPALEAALDAQ